MRRRFWLATARFTAKRAGGRFLRSVNVGRTVLFDFTTGTVSTTPQTTTSSGTSFVDPPTQNVTWRP